jgi:SAM-dependent methyltransferase
VSHDTPSDSFEAQEPGSPQLPLHQMDPLQRFSDRAKAYAQHRPGYPVAALAAILSDLGDPRQLSAADVGAGTGISAQLLAAQGVQVWAVEPNRAMREAITPHPLLTVVDGTAEHTTLANQSVQLVTCFQAFHWFTPELCLREFLRILKPLGRLALVWNVRDCDDALTDAYTQIIREASNNHPGVDKMHRDPTPYLLNQPAFSNFRQLTFAYRQPLNLQGLIGRATSTSYLPCKGEAYERLVRALTHLHQQWANGQGLVELVHQTQVYLAEARQ